MERGTRVVFKWLRDNVALGPSDRYHFSPDSSTLLISPVRKEDRGTYRCVASNAVSPGQHSGAVELNVYCEYYCLSVRASVVFIMFSDTTNTIKSNGFHIGVFLNWHMLFSRLHCLDSMTYVNVCQVRLLVENKAVMGRYLHVADLTELFCFSLGLNELSHFFLVVVLGLNTEVILYGLGFF